MQRWNVLALAAPALFLSAGCATSPHEPQPGPRVRDRDTEWRRKSVPLPPLYWQFTSGSGKRWTMVTPFYWQVAGATSTHHHLVPFAHYSSEREPPAEGGHVLNYFWGKSPRGRHRVAFPVYWSFQRPEAETSLYGPVYHRREEANGRRRLLVFPWLFSSESDDASGYDYWGVLFRLLGYEKQVFDGEQKERLWLLFAFHVDTV
jgi:hypothetical protein